MGCTSSRRSRVPKDSPIEETNVLNQSGSQVPQSSPPHQATALPSIVNNTSPGSPHKTLLEALSLETTLHCEAESMKLPSLSQRLNDAVPLQPSLFPKNDTSDIESLCFMKGFSLTGVAFSEELSPSTSEANIPVSSPHQPPGTTASSSSSSSSSSNGRSGGGSQVQVNSAGAVAFLFLRRNHTELAETFVGASARAREIIGGGDPQVAVQGEEEESDHRHSDEPEGSGSFQKEDSTEYVAVLKFCGSDHRTRSECFATAFVARALGVHAPHTTLLARLATKPKKAEAATADEPRQGGSQPGEDWHGLRNEVLSLLMQVREGAHAHDSSVAALARLLGELDHAQCCLVMEFVQQLLVQGEGDRRARGEGLEGTAAVAAGAQSLSTSLAAALLNDSAARTGEEVGLNGEATSSSSSKQLLECVGEQVGRVLVLDLTLRNADRFACSALGWRGNPGNLLLAPPLSPHPSTASHTNTTNRCLQEEGGGGGGGEGVRLVAIDSTCPRAPPTTATKHDPESYSAVLKRALNGGAREAGDDVSLDQPQEECDDVTTSELLFLELTVGISGEVVEEEEDPWRALEKELARGTTRTVPSGEEEEDGDAIKKKQAEVVAKALVRLGGERFSKSVASTVEHRLPRLESCLKSAGAVLRGLLAGVTNDAAAAAAASSSSSSPAVSGPLVSSKAEAEAREQIPAPQPPREDGEGAEAAAAVSRPSIASADLPPPPPRRERSTRPSNSEDDASKQQQQRRSVTPRGSQAQRRQQQQQQQQEQQQQRSSRGGTRRHQETFGRSSSSPSCASAMNPTPPCRSSSSSSSPSSSSSLSSARSLSRGKKHDASTATPGVPKRRSPRNSLGKPRQEQQQQQQQQRPFPRGSGARPLPRRSRKDENATTAAGGGVSGMTAVKELHKRFMRGETSEAEAALVSTWRGKFASGALKIDSLLSAGIRGDDSDGREEVDGMESASHLLGTPHLQQHGSLNAFLDAVPVIPGATRDKSPSNPATEPPIGGTVIVGLDNPPTQTKENAPSSRSSLSSSPWPSPPQQSSSPAKRPLLMVPSQPGLECVESALELHVRLKHLLPRIRLIRACCSSGSPPATPLPPATKVPPPRRSAPHTSSGIFGEEDEEEKEKEEAVRWAAHRRSVVMALATASVAKQASRGGMKEEDKEEEEAVRWAAHRRTVVMALAGSPPHERTSSSRSSLGGNGKEDLKTPLPRGHPAAVTPLGLPHSMEKTPEHIEHSQGTKF